MGHDVFISYAADNKLVADAILERLEEAEIKCWIAPRNIRPGDSWGGAIVRAIETSKILVLVFSSKSNQSQQVLREVERAVQRDVVLLPFRIEDIVPSIDLEYFLSTTQWLDAFGTNLEEHLDSLVDTTKHIIAQRAANDPASLPIQSVLAEDLQAEVETPLETDSRAEDIDTDDSSTELSLESTSKEPSTSEIEIRESLVGSGPNKTGENPDIFEKLTALNLVSKETDELNDVVERMKRSVEEQSNIDHEIVEDYRADRAETNQDALEENPSNISPDGEDDTENLISDSRLERSISEIELDGPSAATPQKPEPKPSVSAPSPELIIERNHTRKTHSTHSSSSNSKLPFLLIFAAILIAAGWYGFQNREQLIGPISTNTDSVIETSNKNEATEQIEQDVAAPQDIGGDTEEVATKQVKAQPKTERAEQQVEPKNGGQESKVARQAKPKPETPAITPNKTIDKTAAVQTAQTQSTEDVKLLSPTSAGSEVQAEAEGQLKAEAETVIPQAQDDSQLAAAQALREAQLKEEQQRTTIGSLQSAAEQGKLDAVLGLAEAYELGIGVDKDPTESAKWIRVAAENGHADSQFKLSKLLSESTSSDQDLQTAVYWAEQAANQNHPQAQNLLGLWYEKGLGVDKNYSTAYQWYSLAAQAGDRNGQKSLGIFNEFGLGRPQNHQEALRWYKLAADQGDARANFFFKQLTERIQEANSSD